MSFIHIVAIRRSSMVQRWPRSRTTSERPSGSPSLSWFTDWALKGSGKLVFKKMFAILDYLEIIYQKCKN